LRHTPTVRAADLVSLIQIGPPPVGAVQIGAPVPARLGQIHLPPVIAVQVGTPLPTSHRRPTQHDRPAIPPQFVKVLQPAHLVHPSLSQVPYDVDEQPQQGDGTGDDRDEESTLDK